MEGVVASKVRVERGLPVDVLPRNLNVGPSDIIVDCLLTYLPL